MDGQARNPVEIQHLPLGGYVRTFGDADAASTPDTQKLTKMQAEEYALTSQSKTPWQRIMVSAGGDPHMHHVHYDRLKESECVLPLSLDHHALSVIKMTMLLHILI